MLSAMVNRPNALSAATFFHRTFVWKIGYRGFILFIR
jgi:hypothetical protein